MADGTKEIPGKEETRLHAWKQILRYLRRLRLLEVNIYSAYASYFLVLSAFPAMMLVIGALQYTPVSERELQVLLQRILPASLLPLLNYMVEELFAFNSVAALSVSAGTALWMASKGVYSIQLGLNKVYAVRETRGFLRVRLRCVGFTVLLLGTLLVASALHLAGQDWIRRLSRSDDPASRLLLRLIRLKAPLTTVLLALLFLSLYCVFPNRPVRAVSALPGAFSAAVLWMLFTRLFSVYAEKFGHYSLYYGSLSVMALAMLWLYTCMFLLFCGGILNCELERRAAGKRGRTEI